MTRERQAGFVDGPEPRAPLPPTPTTQDGPPVEPEAGFLSGAVEPAPEEALPTERRGEGAEAGHALRSLVLASGGLALLVFGGAVLAFVGFVIQLFERHPLLGWVGTAVLVGGLALVGRAILVELRGLSSVQVITRLREQLADRSCPIDVSRASSLSWARRVAQVVPEAAKAIPEIERAASRDELIATLRSAVIPWIEPRVTHLGRRQSMIVFTASAASPSPALDTVIVLWRGIALVGAIARLYGARPGALGLARLVANVSLSAAATAAADAAGSAAAKQFVDNALVAKLAGGAAGASLAALRMIRLAQATAIACSPIPR